MSQPPTPRFVQAALANLAYWQNQSEPLTDERIQVLNQEHGNLLQAVSLGLRLPECQTAAAQLALQLMPFIEWCSHWQRWLTLWQQAVKEIKEREESLHVALLTGLGQLWRLDRQLTAAEQTYQQASHLAQQTQAVQLQAEAEYGLSVVHRLRHQYDTAEQHGQFALTLFRQLALSSAPLLPLSPAPLPQARITAVINTLGLIAQARGKLPLAEKRLQEAAELGRQVNPPTLLARTLLSLAVTLQQQKKYDEALRIFQEAASLLEPTASELDKIRVQISLGSLYYEMERLDKAEAVFRQTAYNLRWQTGPIYYQAMANHSLGNVLLKQNRLTEAETHLRQSLALWRQTNDELMLANTLGGLGECMACLARPAEAKTFYDEALTLLAKHITSAWANKLRREFGDEREALDGKKGS